MKLGTVIGRVTLSQVVPELQGARWLIVSPFTREQFAQGVNLPPLVGPDPSLVVYDALGGAAAFLGGLLFSFLPGSTSNINNSDFSLGGLLVSFVGAVVLLAIVNFATRGRVR